MPDPAAGFDEEATALNRQEAAALSKEGTVNVRVRAAKIADCDAVSRMCAELWPDGSAEEHGREVLRKIEGPAISALPVAIFVAEAGAEKSPSNTRDATTQLIGFVEVGLRSHADGCDESHPMGYLEGWFVKESCRHRGVGGALVAVAEEWCRGQGCVEMASDTWIDNEPSQRAHEALGYKAVDRCILYRKAL